MPKFAIIATLDIAPGRREHILPMLMAHRDRCLKDEPGTLHFEILIPREEDSKVVLYEVYRDDAAFEAHRKGPSIAQWRKEAAGMLGDLHVTRCTPVE
jgi:quinol monooxygenase YgiN